MFFVFNICMCCFISVSCNLNLNDYKTISSSIFMRTVVILYLTLYLIWDNINYILDKSRNCCDFLKLWYDIIYENIST